MNRKSFIKASVLGGLAFGLGSFSQQKKTHILSLSFDDGFKKSFFEVADIYEQFDLHACLNVIANPNWSESLGNFDDWNSLQRRGHEIMPHSWNHSNLTQMPFDQAKEDIIKCLDYFEKHLEGFKCSNAVYNFAYNASTQELEQFALSKVRAVRTQGNTAINPIPNSKMPVRVGCWSHGPENIDTWVEQQINDFLASSGGWLVLNLHGLDDEGWGPIRKTFLIDLLKRLTKLDFLSILPVGEVLIKNG